MSFKSMQKHIKPIHVKLGAIWYDEANSFVIDNSKGLSITPEQLAGVTSAISPMKEWTTNKKLALKVVKAFLDGQDMPSYSFGSNNTKAWSILNCNGTHDAVQAYFKEGSKTFNFYNNLMGDYSNATLDSHMLNMYRYNGARVAISNDTKGSKGARQPKKQEKSDMLKSLLELQLELELKYDCNLELAQTQAILWLAYKDLKIKGVK